jgi:hypothetical protein
MFSLSPLFVGNELAEIYYYELKCIVYNVPVTVLEINSFVNTEFSVLTP